MTVGFRMKAVIPESAFECLKSARSGRSENEPRTGKFDPELPFKANRTKGRKARGSGLRLKASVGSRGGRSSTAKVAGGTDPMKIDSVRAFFSIAANWLFVGMR